MTINKDLQKTTTKVEKKIMMTSEGTRVHKMNINFKNKLLSKLEFSLEKTFNNKTNKILKLDSNKHFKRLINELKSYKITNKNIIELNYENLKIRSNIKYYVVVLNDNRYLCKANKGLIIGYLLIK